MGGKTRERLWRSRAIGAHQADHARKQAEESVRLADAAACLLWSEQMEGFGGPSQPSPTIGQALNGGYCFLEVQCKRCETRTSVPLEFIPPIARDADLEARGVADVSAVRTVRAAPTADDPDQVDQDEGDDVVSVASSV